ncbi:MAG TPA: hypothetical protein DCG42_05435 [Maribacter sp.]|nr:hypothetical protein [Maribacter sp.]|tara:strand:- start:249 stop:449 length:201 start_codon:yes stop_codon:yes gene_type:complete
MNTNKSEEKTKRKRTHRGIRVPIDVYEEIKNMSKVEGRTIGGQMKYIFGVFKSITNQIDKVKIHVK